MQFIKIQNNKQYAKLVFFGESGAGKTTTACYVASGLVGAGGTIGFIDTENSACYFEDYFHSQNITLLSNGERQPATFKELINGINDLIVNHKVDCIILDSITWVGDQLIDNSVLEMQNKKLIAKGKAKREELSYGDRSFTKNMQEQFVNLFKQTSCHFIICGRPTSATKQDGLNVINVPIQERNVKGFGSIKFEGDFTAFFEQTDKLEPKCTIIRHRCLDMSKSLQGKSFIKPKFVDFEKGLNLKINTINEIFNELKHKILACKDIAYLEILKTNIVDAQKDGQINEKEINELRSIYQATARNLSLTIDDINAN